MLAHPSILPSIGNASAETAQLPYCIQGIPDNYEILINGREQHQKSMENVLPRDGRRRIYADVIARIAFDFFVTHEMSHISYGHCQYINTPQMLLMEKGEIPKEVSPLASQALEFHADASASLETWKLYLEGTSQLQRIDRGKFENGNGLVIVEELLMFDWVFAMFVVIWLLGQETDPKALLTERHPPPSERAIAAMANVYGWLKKTATKERQDLFERARLLAFQAASDALNILTTGQFIPNLDAYLRLHNNGVIIEHYRSVGATMQKIIEDVKKFSHCEFNCRFQVTADLPNDG
jgi:hypothetical protein